MDLPRLSGQTANTMKSVGNEQRRSTEKFVLEKNRSVKIYIQFFFFVQVGQQLTINSLIKSLNCHVTGHLRVKSKNLILKT